jgi:hypothetical protein
MNTLKKSYCAGPLGVFLSALAGLLLLQGCNAEIRKSDAELVSAVNVQIKKRRQQGVSRDTILRAAGRRK